MPHASDEHLKVRRLGLSDREAATALYGELTGDDLVVDGSEGAARWADLLGHPGTTVLGAEADGPLVAMVTLHILPNMTYGGRPYGLIENVVTGRAHRGLGIGRRIMAEAVAAAWAAGAYKIMLLTGQQRGARGFYEKLGFTDEKYGMTLRHIS